jgi:hypothetical protein
MASGILSDIILFAIIYALLDVACDDLFYLAEVSLAIFPEALPWAGAETRTLRSVLLPFQASGHAAYGPIS